MSLHNSDLQILHFIILTINYRPSLLLQNIPPSYFCNIYLKQLQKLLNITYNMFQQSRS